MIQRLSVLLCDATSAVENRCDMAVVVQCAEDGRKERKCTVTKGCYRENNAGRRGLIAASEVEGFHMPSHRVNPRHLTALAPQQACGDGFGAAPVI
jgi:hypothetical protein